MKKIITIIVVSVCAFAYADVDDVDVSIGFEDGKSVSEKQKMVQIEKNVWRFQYPKEKMKGVKYVEVVADVFRAKKGDDGYFISATQMGTFHADEGSTGGYPPLPIYGIKSPKGTFVAIIKGLRFECAVNYSVKNGNYKISTVAYTSSKQHIPGGAYEDLIIDFYKLEGKDANYSGMARTYRKYQLDRGAVKPLRERVKNNPVLAYTVDSMFIRIKNGVKNNKNKIETQTPENEPKIIVMHSFDDCMRIMKTIKSMGVEKAEMCLVGWNAGGFDGRYPQLLPIPEEFGGEKKLRETIKTAKDLGYQITNHICNLDIYEISDDWDEKYVARRANGKMLRQNILAGGRAYLPCQKMHYETFVTRDNKIILDLGFKGTQHNDVYTCRTPYPCFDPRHPCTNADTAKYMGLVAKASQEAHGGFGSESAFDSFAGNTDFALYVWAYPNHMGRKHPLFDKGPVPVWQIIYHGIILSNPYWDTIDPTYPTSSCGKTFSALGVKWKKVLKMAELNGRPVFYFYDYKDLNIIKEAYDLYQPMKYLQYEFMDEHSELTKDVFLTVFSDGSRIVTNYSDSDFVYKGETVKARDYKLFKPTFWEKIKRFVSKK